MHEGISHCNFDNKLFALPVIIFLYKKAVFMY
jgi:hypothetical protein